MDKLIYKYFEKNYKLTLSTYSSFQLYDKVNEKSVTLKTILTLISQLFSVTLEEVSEVFNSWSDKESIIINNRIVELEEQLNTLSSEVVKKISPKDINRILFSESPQETSEILKEYFIE
tara:strand:- start:10895 stop:11251 length:357 start_codon:yes stop_codon:yes gene_type:complete